MCGHCSRVLTLDLLLLLQTRSPEEYRITARIPTDCVVSECTVFVGIDTNDGESTYLDIYMEGTAQAWVAVGFSESQNMVCAYIFGLCASVYFCLCGCGLCVCSAAVE